MRKNLELGDMADNQILTWLIRCQLMSSRNESQTVCFTIVPLQTDGFHSGEASWIFLFQHPQFCLSPSDSDHLPNLVLVVLVCTDNPMWSSVIDFYCGRVKGEGDSFSASKTSFPMDYLLPRPTGHLQTKRSVWMLVNPSHDFNTLTRSLSNLIMPPPRVAYRLTPASTSSSALAGSFSSRWHSPLRRFPSACAELFLAALKGNPLAIGECFFTGLPKSFWERTKTVHPIEELAQANFGTIPPHCNIIRASLACIPHLGSAFKSWLCFVSVPWQVTLLWYFFPGGVKL